MSSKSKRWHGSLECDSQQQLREHAAEGTGGMESQSHTAVRSLLQGTKRGPEGLPQPGGAGMEEDVSALERVWRSVRRSSRRF